MTVGPASTPWTLAVDNTGGVAWAPLSGSGSNLLTLQIPSPFAVAVDVTTLYVSSGSRLYAIPKGH